MAIGEPLPGGDHIVRGCSRGHDNGEVTASAFELRERDRPFLRISVDWVECPYVDLIDQTPKESVKRSKRKMVRGPYAVLSVLDIREAKLKDRVLDVLEVGVQSGEPSCHCGITGFCGGVGDYQLQVQLAEVANRRSLIG